jgi:hypothetical protein
MNRRFMSLLRFGLTLPRGHAVSEKLTNSTTGAERGAYWTAALIQVIHVDGTTLNLEPSRNSCHNPRLKNLAEDGRGSFSMRTGE